MELDGEVREVGEGDAILIPPGAWHELRAGPDGVRLLCCLRAAVQPRRHVLLRISMQATVKPGLRAVPLLRGRGEPWLEPVSDPCVLAGCRAQRGRKFSAGATLEVAASTGL